VGLFSSSPTPFRARSIWLRLSLPPIDSPTQRAYRSNGHLEGAFKTRQRRPEWVWAAGRGDRVVAVVAALAASDRPDVIDHMSSPGATAAEHADFASLAAHATDDFCRRGGLGRLTSTYIRGQLAAIVTLRRADTEAHPLPLTLG
jgi:hypothetical protein